MHRVAISNRRITSIGQGRISFGTKDSRTETWQTTSLPALEFIRRFLRHVLPKGFNKIRYYSLLSPTNRKTLKRVQLLLTRPEAPKEQADPAVLQVTNLKESARPCPRCGEGWLVVIGRLPRLARTPPWG